jgi:serine/threonine protein kinase
VIGTLIADKYELLGELGNSSGLGLTYKAKQTDDGRLMAVKVVSVPGDDVNLKRYEQGIASARLLNHPNIVCIVDSGVTAKGSPFYVTDFVEGRTLGEILREVKRMPVERVAPMIAQICDALDHAHYYGVIHRNLTPDNVMVGANSEGSETVHVLDFGLAKSFFMANKPDHKLTNAGDIIGNPEYLSPEQCMWKESDWRSDIYSLGCLTYHMLAGKPPFRGTSKLDTLVKHAKEVPADLLSAAPDAAIPPAVRDVVMRALEKDPINRQQTTILFRDEFLQACL